MKPGALSRRLEQIEGPQAQSSGDFLHRLQREVPLSALDRAHVGAMHSEHFGEVFLAQTALDSVRAQVHADGLLQLPGHAEEFARVLLDGLQTYE